MNDDIKYIITVGIVIISIIVSLILSIAIPCLISEKRNIEKELKLKQIEIYGEKINKEYFENENN